MDKKIGLFWLEMILDYLKNNGLIEATKNHNEVVVFYLYKKHTYSSQEAQKWWLTKSLISFKKKFKQFE
jgi:deoxyribodipyrimidine photolyase